MGMPELKEYEDQPKVEEKKQSTYYVDIDDISEKLAIVQSKDYEGSDVLPTIDQLKRDLEFGRVKPEYKQYWA